MAEQFEHIPVLLEPVLEYLTFPTNRPVRLIDGTLGGAGHSSLLLSRLTTGKLIAFDQDPAAIENAKDINARMREAFGENFYLVFGNHDDEQGVDKETLLKMYQKNLMR